MLGQLIGSMSAYLATERALELFAPIQQSDYVGWNGGFRLCNHWLPLVSGEDTSAVRTMRFGKPTNEGK